MYTRTKSLLSADENDGKYYSADFIVTAEEPDEITFTPQDEEKPITPEDIGMDSLDTVVSNVHQLFDADRQDRFFFD